MNLASPATTPSTLLPWFVRYAWGASMTSACVLHGAAFGLLFWFVRSREDLVILRYNAYLGIDLLGVWWQIFLVPGVTFFFVLFNFWIAKMLTLRDYPQVAGLLLLGNVILSGAVVVVALALSFVNV